ncbi:MAG: 4-alpha-glucanotransferase [Solirubrobacterales bacterium]|nr:4-alpha-glucanotransferase [Solirubrobacterales bacterium]
MNLPRSSGVQLHPTSLPGGRLGPEALAFVDWLAEAGQSWWQMLPLNPPDRHGSPYKAESAFAAWPGLLAEPDAPVSEAEIAEFRRRQSFWLDDWEAYAGDGAAADQVRFDREWAALRDHATGRGVRLIGDVPIYVAPDAADHRAHPELFRSGEVAGVPPDAFTEKGQLWGNPLYDWPRLSRRRYSWWTERLRRTFELFDVARIDHFRGFTAYWAVPEEAEDARTGRWLRGPGRAPFDAAARALGRDLPVIAEDLGVITPGVRRLRDTLGFPGMVVLQFGFDPGDPQGTHRLENHIEGQVAYTGTHDNDTLAGWYASLPADQREEVDAAREKAGVADAEPWWGLIEMLHSSPARLAMVQLQDVLGLGSEARMNLPGQTGAAWKWRMEPDALTPEAARRLEAITKRAGRLA